MPRSLHRRAPGWLGLLGVLATSLGAMGCPGTLDPSLLTGGGGTTGGPGTAGTNGGAGTGGTGVNCAGDLDGATIVMTTCTPGCHDSAGGILSAGLNLTVDAAIGSRLVGVNSPGNAGESSVCAGFGPYLKPNSNPAAGLLIDKISLPSGNPAVCPGGSQMPFGLSPLAPAQQACVEQWAETLIMAAAAQ
jgi:hypothetical protein